MLSFFSRLIAVDYLSLVEYEKDSRSRSVGPELREGHARSGVKNVTPDCFALYRQCFWREDDGTRVAQRLSEQSLPGVAAMHVRADDIQVPAWREEIYERAHLAGRLTFFYSPVPGRTFSVNLYRDRAGGHFNDGEVGRLLDVACLVRQAHKLVLTTHCTTGCATSDREAQIARAQLSLRRGVPELTPRELAVCARIACGMSADGIAVDLGVAASTVKTLRKRAYSKLAERGIVGGRLRLALMPH
jgi:DNA-binding CsgD family transcriptional regulator